MSYFMIILIVWTVGAVCMYPIIGYMERPKTDNDYWWQLLYAMLWPILVVAAWIDFLNGKYPYD